MKAKTHKRSHIEHSQTKVKMCNEKREHTAEKGPLDHGGNDESQQQ